MRWTKEVIPLGTERTITKYAYFPITIGVETRMWETVTIRQKYSQKWMAMDGLEQYWENMEFVNAN